MAISNRVSAYLSTSSAIRRMFEEGLALKARFGADAVCDFSIGNPDVPPPAAFRRILREEAAVEEPQVHGYMPNAGHLFVRDAIARRINALQGTDLDSRHVVVTCGAGGALNVALKALVNPGDEVLACTPSFLEYRFYCENHGASFVTVPGRPDFDLDVDALAAAISERTAAVIVNSPNNPSGRIYPESTLRNLGRMLQARSSAVGRTVYLLGDEPYRDITYGDRVPSLFAVYPHTVVCTSWSKTLSLPGERIGFLAVHREAEDSARLLEACALCNRILGFVNAPALMQRVIARLQDEAVDVEVYRRRRDAMTAILDAAGYAYAAPQGTFYLFVRSPLVNDVDFVDRLKDERILTVPGSAFGWPGWFRIAYCTDEAVIARSADGFEKAMRKAAGA